MTSHTYNHYYTPLPVIRTSKQQQAISNKQVTEAIFSRPQLLRRPQPETLRLALPSGRLPKDWFFSSRLPPPLHAGPHPGDLGPGPPRSLADWRRMARSGGAAAPPPPLRTLRCPFGYVRGAVRRARRRNRNVAVSWAERPESRFCGHSSPVQPPLRTAPTHA